MTPYRAWPFLSDPAHPFLSAVWAVLIHGAIALVVVGPILWRSRRRRLFWSAIAFVGGSLLDVDHFIAAGTFDLHRIETLGGRPATHSLVFVAALALVVVILTRRPLWGWTVFAVNVAHLLFDGAGGNERIYYPLRSPQSVPWLACPLGTLVLCAVSFAIARRMPDRPSDPLGGGALRSPDLAGAGP